MQTRTKITCALPVVAAVLLSGCADLGKKLVQSESPFDFALAVAGHEHTEAFSVEKKPGGNGVITSAHAHRDSKGAFVYGRIEKGFAPGWVSSAWAHVDVEVVDSGGRRIEAVTTSFSPSTVPHTHRGVVGRSSYFVRLQTIPPVGSKVLVAFHSIPRKECEHFSEQSPQSQQHS